MRAGSLDGGSTAWRLGGAGSLDANGKCECGDENVSHDDKDEEWEDFSHARA